jgi:pimeloyl-ACP methyl ester carboxylesterase
VALEMIAIDDRGAGRPLVLLHGVGASRGVWRRVAPRLSADRRVLAPDLPGFGGSSPAGPGFNLDAAAAVLVDALADRAGEPFDLVGNSLGGAVALALADLRPEFVRSLVLSAPAGFSAQPWPVAFAAGRLIEPAITVRRVLGTPLAALPAARRALLWGSVADPERMATADAVSMLQAARGSTRIGAAVSAVLREDLGDQLRELDVPLGVIWGKHDRVVPAATLDRIRALRPDAVVETLDRAGHVPQLERPIAFVNALRRILAITSP